MEVLFVFSSVLTTTTIAFVNKPVIYLPATESLAFYVTGPEEPKVCRNINGGSSGMRISIGYCKLCL